MKRLFARLSLIAAFALALPLAAWAQVGQTLDAPLSSRLQPLENFVNLPFETSKPLRLDQISQAIQRAGARRGWTIVVVRPGVLVGTLNIRSHQAVVDIVHDTHMFSIVYKSSANLQYNAARQAIHRNYNAWVRNLRGDILHEMALL